MEKQEIYAFGNSLASGPGIHLHSRGNVQQKIFLDTRDILSSWGNLSLHKRIFSILYNKPGNTEYEHDRAVDNIIVHLYEPVSDVQPIQKRP
jgi:hypothetical protein